jgi:hypothetical protein
MELLLTRCSTIVRRIRQKQRILNIEQIKQMLDEIISYLNKINSHKNKNDGLHILTSISDELATLNTFRLFDYSILRNHHIFKYIFETSQMLLIKSLHSQTIKMNQQEEDCLNSTTYLMTQLCLYQNETVKLFYGKVSTEVFQVTEKPNPRDKQINKKPVELTEKPNLKSARLPPTAPSARPIEEREADINKISKLKKFPYQFDSIMNIEYSTYQYNRIEFSPNKFEEIFLRKSLIDTIVRLIDDLSKNEYSSYHIKYKVAGRFVHLFSQLNIVDVLLNPIIKCLRSKYYRQIFETIQFNQIQLNPKQLFFIHQCPQFIIQHQFLQKDQIASILSKSLIESTKPIFEKYLFVTGKSNTI